jgi:A/G-specific adenine glycosylase
MADFNPLIKEWYRLNKRDLPWRLTKDPFKIWLSEIILQQTKVEQGLSYYLKFTNRFKTAEDLANTSEQEVLNLWQGLGYYSRARNLHFTAKTVVNEHKGKFPKTYTELLSSKV